MRIFEKKKTVKIASATGAPPPNPRLPPSGLLPAGPRPRVITLVYYYYFVQFVSSAKYVLLPSKKNKIAAINVLLLPNFCTNF